MPTDVYWGEFDTVLPRNHETFWARIGNPLIKVNSVPKAGHMPFYKKPEMVAEWIVDACRV